MRGMTSAADDAAIYAIERPHPSLWRYYLIASLIIPPLFPIVVVVAWFRYSTMRYRFTPDGVSMRWGILFRREIIIQYARIQDIHLRSNVVERWLGLARVLVQTASGNATAEMTLEGLKEFEAVRDFLYARMRGVREQPAGPAGEEAELAGVLREVAAEVRALRETLAGGAARGASGEVDRV